MTSIQPHQDWVVPSLEEITAAEGRADERDIHIDNGNGNSGDPN